MILFFFGLILGHFWVDEVRNFRLNQGFDGGSGIPISWG